MKQFLSITSVIFLLVVLVEAQASWNYVTQVINSDSEVTDCIFLAGNNGTGPAFTLKKGTALSSTSQRISVASGSKWPAASIIYRLVEDGALNLDDLVSQYLSYWTTSPSDPRHSVTLRQLLAFTSGFTDDDVCCGSRDYTLQSCAQQIYNNATGSKFNAPAGSTFYYGCNNLQVAGAVAEVASGLSWNQLFASYWKTPLGITSSLTVWTPAPSNNPNIAGGLFCSTHEYLRWLLAMFENRFFAKKNTLQIMLADETANATIGYSPIAAIQPRQVWHYCQGHWLECEQTPFSGSQCYPRDVHSSPGKFGFYPRIDFANRYWSIVARYDTGFLAYSQSVEMFQKIESNVTALLAQPAATSTASVSSNTGTTKSSTRTSASMTTAPASTSLSSSSSSPTRQTNSGDGGDQQSGNGGGCFAASSLVRVLDLSGQLSSKPLSDLLPGELVESFDQHSLRTVFEPVWFVAHRQGSAPVQLLELSFATDGTVKATPNHLLLVAKRLQQPPEFVQAGQVRVGDFLFTVGTGNASTPLVAQQVTAIRRALEQVRNPLTRNNRIVVSGVAGSVFVQSHALYSVLVAPFKLLATALPEHLAQSPLLLGFFDLLVAISDFGEALVTSTLFSPSVLSSTVE